MKSKQKHSVPTAKARTPEAIASHLELLVDGLVKVTPDASKAGCYSVSLTDVFTLEDANGNVDELETQLSQGIDNLSDVLRDLAYAIEQWSNALAEVRKAKAV